MALLAILLAYLLLASDSAPTITLPTGSTNVNIAGVGFVPQYIICHTTPTTFGGANPGIVTFLSTYSTTAPTQTSPSTIVTSRMQVTITPQAGATMVTVFVAEGQFLSPDFTMNGGSAPNPGSIHNITTAVDIAAKYPGQERVWVIILSARDTSGVTNRTFSLREHPTFTWYDPTFGLWRQDRLPSVTAIATGLNTAFNPWRCNVYSSIPADGTYIYDARQGPLVYCASGTGLSVTSGTAVGMGITGAIRFAWSDLDNNVSAVPNAAKTYNVTMVTKAGTTVLNWFSANTTGLIGGNNTMSGTFYLKAASTMNTLDYNGAFTPWLVDVYMTTSMGTGSTVSLRQIQLAAYTTTTRTTVGGGAFPGGYGLRTNSNTNIYSSYYVNSTGKLGWYLNLGPYFNMPNLGTSSASVSLSTLTFYVPDKQPGTYLSSSSSGSGARYTFQVTDPDFANCMPSTTLPTYYCRASNFRTETGLRLVVATATNTTTGAKLTRAQLVTANYPIPVFTGDSAIHIGGGVYSFGIRTASSLNFKDFKQWDLTTTLLDDHGGSWGAYSTTMTVVVVKSNEPPILGPLAKTNPWFRVYENASNGDDFAYGLLESNYTINTEAPAQRLLLAIMNVTYMGLDEFGNTTLQLTDPDAFAVDVCGGSLAVGTLAGQLNYGTSPNYTINFQTCDSGIPPMCVEWSARIMVVEANRPPVSVNDTVYMSVSENSGRGTVLDFVDDVSGPLVVDTNTPAAPVAWRTLSYSITLNAPGNIFTINATTGVVSVANGGESLLNYEDPSANDYSIIITATDGGGLSVDITLMIAVLNINEPPQYLPSSVSQVLKLAEWTVRFPHFEFDLVGTPVTAVDPDDGDTITYALLGQPIPAPFAINDTTGQIYLTAAGAAPNRFDYEAGPRTYNVTVAAVDGGGLSSVAYFTLQITDVNEPPVAFNVGFTIPENSAVGTVLGGLNATDPEGGLLTFQLSGGLASSFALQAGSVVVANSAILDFETRSTIVITYTATDGGITDGVLDPLTSLPASITITLTNVNEAPGFVNSTCVMRLPENAPIGTEAGRLFGTDPDFGQTAQLSFSFQASTLSVTPNPRAFTTPSFGTPPVAFTSSPGQLLSTRSLDYEQVVSLGLTAVVSDPGNLQASLACTVQIIDVNEAPVFTQGSYTLFVPKNAAKGLSAGTITAYDPDVNDNVTYIITPESDAESRLRFAINLYSGQVTMNTNHTSPNTPLTAGRVYNFTVMAKDVAGLNANTTVNVIVTDVNSPPIFLSSSYARSIKESATGGTALTGGSVTATDPDVADQSGLSYRIIAGNAGNVFTVDSSTGVITLSGSLNYESVPQYAITLEARDPGGLTGTTLVVISVGDVNEAPTWSGSNLAFSVDENSPVGTLTSPPAVMASDPDSSDAGKLEYTLQTTGTPFAINSTTGVITVISAVLNAETRASYSLTVRATDSGWDGLGRLFSQATVVVTLNNINDAPVETNRKVSTNENLGKTLLATASATDEDSGQTIIYSLSRPDQFCWMTDFLSGGQYRSNTPFEVPIAPLGVTGSALRTVVMRVRTASTLRVMGMRTRPPYGASSDWFEYAFATTGVTARRCMGSNGACSTPVAIPGASSTRNTLLGTDTWAHLYISYAGNGTQEIGWRAANDAVSPLIPLFSFSDTTYVPQYLYVMTGDGTGATRLASFCFVPENSMSTAAAYRTGADADILSLSSSTAEIISPTGGFNFEQAAWVGMEVRAMDFQTNTYLPPFNLSDYATVLVQINDINEAPYFTPISCGSGMYTACFSVPENSPAFTQLGVFPDATDPDTPGTAFSTMTYTLSSVGNTIGALTAFSLVGRNVTVSNPRPNLDYEVFPSFTLTVQVADGGSPSLQNTGSILVELEDVNEPPSIVVQTLSINENSPVGSPLGNPIVCNDPDTPGSANAALTFSIPWQSVPGVFGIDATTGQLTVANAVLDFETRNLYYVAVRCRDRLGNTGFLQSQGNFTVNILNVNEPPTIKPQNRSIFENATAGTAAGDALDASDPDFGTSLTFAIVGGNGSSVFRINRCGGTLEVIPGHSLDYETAQVYVLDVEVMDDGDPLPLTDTARVVVYILDSDDPPILADSMRTVPENSGAGTLVGLPIPVSDPDVFGGYAPWFNITFSIAGGNDRGLFAIHPRTGQLSILTGGPVLLNFEDPTASRYTLTVRASDDGGQSSTCTIVVSTTDVNEAPVWSDSALFTRAIDENCPRSPRVVNEVVGNAVTVTDEDAGQTATLTISIITGNEAGFFFVTMPVAGQVRISLTAAGAAGLDYETRNRYQLTLKASDTGSPSLFTFVNVTINIINRNEAPIFVGAPFTRRVYENATAATRLPPLINATDPEDTLLRYSIVSGNIGGVFDVDSATQLVYVSLPTGLDFETQPSYSVTLKVEDQGTPEGPSAVLSTTALLNIQVIDVNEAPYFVGPSNYYVAENSAGDTLVGFVQAADPDAADQGQLLFTLLSSELSPNGNALFEVASNGAITLRNATAADLDFELKSSYQLRVNVRDTGWDGRQLNTTTTITINLLDVNERPVFIERVFRFLVPRLARTGSVLGRAQALDPDRGEILTWSYLPAQSSITWNNTVLFNINATSGAIYRISERFSLVVDDVFNMTIRVVDRGGLVDSALVTLTVTDADEPPLLFDQSRSVLENSPLDTMVGPALQVSDPDPSTIYGWSIVSGNVGNVFRIDPSSGQLRVNVTAGVLNFEATPVYQLLVRVEDLTGRTALASTAVMTINLIDMNEAPTLPASLPFSVDENSATGTYVGGVTGSDVDAADNLPGALRYTLISCSPGGSAVPFAINMTNGAVSVYNPVINFEAISVYSLVIRVTDSNWDNRGPLSADGTVVITVNNRNDRPVVIDGAGSVNENAVLSAVGSLQVQDEDSGQRFNYTLTRRGDVCWYYPITTTNTPYRVPLALPVKPDDVRVDFRVKSTGTIRVWFEITAGGSRYEFTITQTDVSVRRCASGSCGSPIGGTTSASLLSASTYANLYVYVDRAGGTLELGTRSDPSASATRTPIFSVVDGTPFNVTTVAVSGSTTDTYFTSVCFAHPTAAGNNAFRVDLGQGSVSTSTATDGGALDYESQQVYGLEVRVVDLPLPGLLPASLEEYGVMIVSIQDVNEAPYFVYQNCGNGSYVSCLFIPENSPISTLAGTMAAALDPDVKAVPLQTLSYALKANNNQYGTNAIFGIGTTSRVVSLLQPVLNFEARSSYELLASVTDNGVPSLSSDGTFLLSVVDVNEAPAIVPQTVAVDEFCSTNCWVSGALNGTLVGSPIVATDPDTAGTLFAKLMFNITGGNGAQLFAIHPWTGQITVANAKLINYEVQKQYTVTVRVTDLGGAVNGLWAEAPVTIRVQDINEAPTLYPFQVRSIAEDVVSPAQAGTGLQAYDEDEGQQLSFYIIGGNGSDIFRINRCAGIIELKAGQRLNYETNQSYSLQIQIMDDGTPSLTANASMTVIVLDANDPPAITDQARSVPENSVPGTLVGAVIPWSDPDVFGGFTPWFTMSWSIVSGNERGVFSIDVNTGQIKIARGDSTLLNFEDSQSNLYVLIIKAQDQGGFAADGIYRPPLSSTATVTITVTDVNEAPYFTDATMTRGIDENCPRSPRAVGENVGTAILASDPDSGQAAQLVFAITGGDPFGFFRIVPMGQYYGQITLTANGAALLDYENRTFFDLNVTIMDNGVLTSGLVMANITTRGVVRINVINRNEQPTIADTNRTLYENATINDPVGLVIPATDPEERVGAGLTFSLQSTFGGLFGIDALTGQIKVANPATLDYETTTSYRLIVRVSDTGAPEGSSASLTSQAVVWVFILDVNEPPSLTAATFTIQENRLLGFYVGSMWARASDPDVPDVRIFSIVSMTPTGGLTPSMTPFAIDAYGNITVAGANGTGVVSDIDYETRQSYIVVVQVTDKGGLFAMATVTVQIQNVNEPPVWRAVPVFFALAQELQDVGLPLSTFVVDPDLAVPSTGESLTFAFNLPSGDTIGAFSIVPSTGQLRVVNGTRLLFPNGAQVGPQYTLSIKVTDLGINGAPITASATVIIEVTDNNFPPTVPSYTFYLNENSGLFTTVGQAFGADRNALEGQNVTYSLSPSGSNVNRAFPFAIRTLPGGNLNVGIGDIFVISDPREPALRNWTNLDYEAPTKAQGSATPGFSVYTMTVTATDSHRTHLTGTGSVTVILNDLPEAPYFSATRVPNSGFYSLSVPENSARGVQLVIDPARSANAGSNQGGLLAVDDDANDSVGALRYAWKTLGVPADQVTSAALFSLDSLTGIVTVSTAGAVAGALDFETRKNYTLTVVCTDTTSRTDEAVITINLIDVNEVSTFVGTGIRDSNGVLVPNLLLNESTTVGTRLGAVAATDVDAGLPGQLRYRFVSDDESQPFALNDVTGVITLAYHVDFEDKDTYRPVVIVDDRSGAPLATNRTFTILISDVSDLTITSIRLASAEEAAGRGVTIGAGTDYDLTHGAMSVVVQTSGGTSVILKGTNLGPTARKLADTGRNTTDSIVRAAYGQTDPYGAWVGSPYTATSCSVWTPYTEILCTTAPGIGVGHAWRVNVSTPSARYTDNVVLTNSVPSQTLLTGYMKPNITAVYLQGASSVFNLNTNDMTTEGGTSIIIEGRDFGPVGSPLLLKYGPTGSEYASPSCVHVVAHYKIRCISAPGVGRDMLWRLTVGGTGMQRSQLFSNTVVRYSTPQINSISSPVLRTSGGESVILYGTNLGPVPVQGGYNVPVSAKYSLYDSNSQRIEAAPWYDGISCRVLDAAPHRAMECQSSAGIGFGHRWAVLIGYQWSPPSPSNETTAYRKPVITRLSGTGSDQANTPGGQPVILTGDQFGPVTRADAAGTVLDVDRFVQPSARYGHGVVNVTLQSSLQYSAVECRVTVADTRMVCNTNEGSGKNLFWGVTVGGQQSGIFWGQTTNYAAPVVAFYSGPGSTHAWTGGFEAVYITGKNFGPIGAPIDSVTYGLNATEFVAQNCSVSVSHVEVTCFTTVGAGSKHRWLLVIDGQESTTPSTDYAPPEIIGLSGPGAMDASTDGGDTIAITGRYFATQEFLQTVTYGPSGTEFTASNCTVTRLHEEITCLTVPGTGRKLRWIVRVALQESQPSLVTSSYGVPNITAIIPSHGPTKGGFTMTLRGSNFGLAIATSQVLIKIDNLGKPRPAQALIDAYWTSARAGAAVQSAVSVWVAELTSPRVEIRTINSRGDHTITFTMPDGFGKARDMFLIVDGVPSDIETFVFDPPKIINVAPDRIGVPLGFLRVFVDGENFCASTACGEVLFDGVAQNPANYTHEQIMVVYPDPQGSSVAVTVVVDGVVSNPFPFSKPEPSFDASVGQGTWTDMDTAGGQPFYIGGVSSISSLTAAEIGILIGGRPCTNIRKSVDHDESSNYGIPSDSPLAEQYRTYRLDAVTPRGIGKDLSIIIKVPGGASHDSQDFRFSYRPPTITDVQDGLDQSAQPVSYLLPTPSGTPPFGIPTVGRLVRVKGSCFGDENLVKNLDGVQDFYTVGGGASVMLTLAAGSVVVPVMNVTDDTLLFYMPAGQGANVSIMVTIGRQSSLEPYASMGVTPQAPTLVRYKTPTITSIEPQYKATVGGDVLTIIGSDFGTAAVSEQSLARGRPLVTFRYADNSVRECALDPTWVPWVNHTKLRCVLPEGQGKDVPVTVTIAGQSSDPFHYTYATPRVYSVYPRGGPTSGAFPDGSQINMTLWGDNLGRKGSLRIEFRRLEIDDADTVFYVPPGQIITQNHSVITFPMPQGVGAQLYIVVIVDGLDSSEDAVTFSYDPPVVNSIYHGEKKPGECDDRIDDSLIINGTVFPRVRKAGCYRTRGGYPLRITGTSFSRYKPVVWLGDQRMDVRSWSHTSIDAIVPTGMGDYNPVVVDVLGRQSPTDNLTIFAYDPPVVSVISPNVPDATGEGIDFRGYGFGFLENPVSIVVGGQTCEGATWYNDQLVRCQSPADTVGPKNVSILAANQSQPFFWYEEEGMIIMQCKKGWYGLAGEYCVDCTYEQRGAVCPGGELYIDKVVSQPGWWRTNMTTPEGKASCHPLRQQREACPVFQPCEPMESCLGANTCSEGYTGDRCSLCVGGKYYRVNGECIKCPDSPWAVVVAFALGAVIALGVAYVLNQKNVSLALISIGIDYFQIVAMFARTRIRWPALVKQLFLIMSAFNFNLEIIAPECAVPEVSYSGKWLFIEGLPMLGWSLLIIMYSVQYVYKRLFTTKRKLLLHSHAPALISTGIVVLRVLYIYITRTTFDVFNCAPTNPPDGKEYMAWNLSIVCYEPGGTHLFLLPFAVAACAIYVAGAPVAALLHLLRNSYACKYDQILRAQGIGNDRLTNPQFFDFRRKWSKLYFHFVPDYYFWEVIITMKKFLIAFISLMFRQSPSYQLALALLVLFGAYVLHMRYLPYMTHAKSAVVLATHRKRAAEGDPLHQKIATEIREAELLNMRKRNNASFGRKDVLADGNLSMTAKRAIITQDMAQRFTFVMSFIDYNTMEAVLLSSAILINLAGIMFDSARFAGDSAKYYASEYDALAGTVVALMFVSIWYYIIAFTMDMWMVCYPDNASRCFAGCARGFENIMSALGLSSARRREFAHKAMGKLGLDRELGRSEESAKTFQNFHTNPLLPQLAAARSAMDGSIAGLSADDIMSMSEPPSTTLWPALRDGMGLLQSKVSELSRGAASMQLELDKLRAERGKYTGRGKELEEQTEALPAEKTPIGRLRSKRATFTAMPTDAVPLPPVLQRRSDAVLRLRALREGKGMGTALSSETASALAAFARMNNLTDDEMWDENMVRWTEGPDGALYYDGKPILNPEGRLLTKEELESCLHM